MRSTTWPIHTVLLALGFLTLLPFFFVFNNLFRTNAEFYRSFFAPPQAFVSMGRVAADTVTGTQRSYEIRDDVGRPLQVDRGTAFRHAVAESTKGLRLAWTAVRPFMFNSIVVVGASAFGVLLLGSVAGYALARYKFAGRNAVYLIIVSTMMFPGVLTLVPSFLLVKNLGLLNTYWAMILPYVAGGQVFAIFVFKSFFEGLPEDLFEAARLDGAGHLRLYLDIVLPLSKPVLSVVLIMNVLGTWNNFLWPFIVNPEGKYHVVASGLYVIASSAYASNFATMYGAYALSSLPLAILFLYATRSFIQGITAGAFKA